METFVLRLLTPLAFCVPLALGGCAGTTAPTVTTDAQLALTDGQAILAALEATDKLPTQFTTDATMVIKGLQAVLTAYAGTVTESAEQQALASAQAAVQQVIADTTDARVKQAGALALSAVAAVSASPTASAEVQVEAALGAVLLDYLATSPATQSMAVAQR